LKELPVLNMAQRTRETNKQTAAIAGSRLGFRSWVAGETGKTGDRGGREQRNQEARDRQMKSALSSSRHVERGWVVALTLWLDLLMHKASLPVLLKVAKLMLLAGLRRTNTGSY
jgi:hypothetical protein